MNVDTPMTYPQQQLAKEHLYLVPMMVAALTRSCTRLSTGEKEELTQIGYLALCRAAQKYDDGRPFEAYAKTAIKHAIYDYWRACKKHKEHSCSLDAMLTDENGSHYERAFIYGKQTYQHTEQEAMQYLFDEYLDKAETSSGCVTKKGIAALRLQADGYTSTDLARLYHVPAGHVRVWQSTARKALKQDEELLALLA